MIIYKLILGMFPESVAIIVSQDASGITEPLPNQKQP